MRYHVLIDCEGDNDHATPWPEYPTLSEDEREREEEDWSQCIGYFYPGSFEADSPEAAIEAAEKWIEDTPDVYVIPGA